MTETELIQALYSRFSKPAYAMFEQVRNETGFARQVRTADALVIGLWPSRGLELHGIEIKASRTDWLKELKNPAKAEEIARFCDRWWLAVSDQAIVKEGELPKTWGLLVPRGKQLIAKIEAPPLIPIPITRAFLAAILRRAADVVTVAARIEEIEKAAYARGVEAGRRETETSFTYEQGAKAYQKLLSNVTKFEQASGVKIEQYYGKEIGKAVSLVRELRWGLPSGLSKRLRESAERIEQLEVELDRLKPEQAYLLDAPAPAP